MFSTPERFTDNGTIPPIQSMAMKKTSARKSLRQFLDTLEAKPKTDVRRFCATKSKRKATEMEVCCGTVYQSDSSIQKSINRSKNIFTIGLYNILRLWCLQ